MTCGDICLVLSSGCFVAAESTACASRRVTLARVIILPSRVGTYTFTLFIKPIGAEFGWGRGTLSAANSSYIICMALTLPFVGALMDRYGVRRVMVPAIVLFGISVAAIALTPAMPAAFIALFALAGILGGVQTPIGYVKSISAWFDAKRGLAMGIAISGIGVGAALLPQFVEWLIRSYGWRSGFMGMGVLVIIIAVPSVLAFIREPFETTQVGTQAANADDVTPLPGISAREARSMSQFWVLAVASFLVGMSVQGVVVHIFPLLTDGGMAPPVAAKMLAIIGIATLLGRLLYGFLVDHFFAPYVSILFFLLPIIGIYLLYSGSFIQLGLIALGLAVGAELDMIGYLGSRYFGLKSFGQIYGWIFSLFSIGCAVGIYVMGLSFDVLGSYAPALLLFGIALIVSCLAMLLLGAYVYPPLRKNR
ncbi:MFS transporter, partial [Eoetvoesiella caeni]